MAPTPFLALRAAALRSSRPSHIGVSLLHSTAIRYNAAAPTQSALEKTLRDALKTAMKSKDKPAATCLKAILADVTNAAKSGPDPNRPATESAVISALRKGIDKRRDAAESYAPSAPSAHADQHASLQSEISLLSSFLPAAPSPEHLAQIITDALDGLSAEVRSGKGAMGAGMKAALERLGAAAAGVDRKEVGRLVSEGLKRLGA